MVLLDSTILIDLLRNEPRAVEKIRVLENSGALLYTTQINIFEVLTGVFAHALNIEKRLLAAETLFQKLKILDVTFSAAYAAGKLAGELTKKGSKISAGDLLVAGTAISNQISEIVTKNAKDFSRIRGIKVESY